jgi:EAL domain-containing protein (putative c-di-GMP-specific phosphodiesterase class I)
VQLPASTLKVDQSFTRALNTDADALAVVSAVLLLGRSLRRTVIVEGVEDAATLRTLRDLGCTHAQGFHLARPQPGDHITAELQRG